MAVYQTMIDRSRRNRMWKISTRYDVADDDSMQVFWEFDVDNDVVINSDSERRLGGEVAEELVSQEERLRRIVEQRGRKLLGDETRWRESVRQQMEIELNRRVREALETPPLEKAQKRNSLPEERTESPDINAHLFFGANDKYRYRMKRWGASQGFNIPHNENLNSGQHIVNQVPTMARTDTPTDQLNYNSNTELRLTHFRHERWPETSVPDSYSRFPDLQPKIRRFYTKDGFVTSLRSGDYPAGVEMLPNDDPYVDKFGIVRSTHGPFWPADYLPLFATPRFKWWINMKPEPLENVRTSNTASALTTQATSCKGQWRGVQLAFDTERSPRDFSPLQVPEGCSPTLMFESRFECGNLRQARRVGQFEYELVLKTDLYTTRHTQWFYFRVQNALPGVTYKLRIINLLKSNSLYNYGMKPLLYSEQDAKVRQRGWVRVGHHISYSRNITNHNCSLLEKGVTYYTLEWQMEFPNTSDTYYLAHCYPYSFTDLKEDLDVLMNDEQRSKVTKREVMCESRAGNCCFLITVTNFDCHEKKKAIVITARVHPGESQASWMMKGLLDFITGPDPAAQKLRNNFIFKIVPMINPDGVIVGNYRCSLAARDLNRNYRHPRQELFPTIWYIKSMVLELSKKHEIALYCDLHGHSRKPNVFMYGNNPSSELSPFNQSMGQAIIADRMFPWIMSLKSPDKFHFQSCKFRIRRCKESTGRVVMWRQMRVLSSFTMEASFSGTVIDRENCRHFNIKDFMEMGRALAEAVLEYQVVKEDPVRQAQTTLGLTKVITEQVLISRGLLKPGSSLTVGQSEITNKPEAMTTSRSSSSSSGNSRSSNNEEVTTQEMTRSNGHNPDKTETTTNIWSPYSASSGDMGSIFNKLSSGCSMEDCFDLLDQLNVLQSLDESDSSDSDSESESEIRSTESKAKKKKRKSKKKPDKEKSSNKNKSGNEEKISMEENKATQIVLPLLNTSSLIEENSLTSANQENVNSWPPKQQIKLQTISEKCRPVRTVQPMFVSKYEGRHNGGLPCFTEERCMERAAQKIAVLKQKQENNKKTEDSLYCFDDSFVPTQEGLRSRQHDGNEEGYLNVKTGYTHADCLYELYPDSFQPISALNTNRKVELLNQNCFHGDSSYETNSTNENASNKNEGAYPFPLVARKSPYYQLDHVYPRPVSEFSYTHTSSLTQNRSKSVSTATSQATTTALPFSISAPLTSTRSHASSAMTGLPSSQNVNTYLTVNSVSTLTPTTTARLSPLTAARSLQTAAPSQTTEQATTSQEVPLNIKVKQSDIKIEPINPSQSTTDKNNNKNIVNSNDLVIISRSCTAQNQLADIVNNAQKENADNRNTFNDLNKSDKGLNMGQLVSHLSQNLSPLNSSWQLPTWQSASRSNQQLPTKSNQQMTPSPSLTTTTLVPVNRSVLSDNLIHKRMA